MSTKDEYVAKMKAKLDEWNAQLDELAAKARQVEAQMRPKYEAQIAELTRKRDAAREKLNDLAGATEDTWQTLQQGAEQVWDDFKGTLQKCQEAFVEGLQQ
jgi:uncharacterized coiled-coil DUF342 family protein